MGSESFILYSNRLSSRPIGSDGVTNAAVLGSTIIGRRATLAPAGAYVDFRMPPTDGIRSIGVAGISLAGSGTPTVTFAFSGSDPGGSDKGAYSFTPVPDGIYRTDARVLDTTLEDVQYCRVSFVHCASVGRCWAGLTLNPSIGVSVGATRRWADLSFVTESDLTGAETVSKRPKRRYCGVKFAVPSYEDWDEDWRAFDDMVVATGESEQAILIAGISPARRMRETMIGRLINLSDESYIAPRLQERPFEFKESL